MAPLAMDLTGQCALVVGGSRGIGAAVALALARAGAQVGVTSRSADGAAKAERELNRQLPNGRITGWTMDVTRAGDAARIIREFAEHTGRLDILVNSAGTAITRFALDIAEEEWDAVINTNLKGSFFTCQAAARIMRTQGGGRLINIASVLGLVVRGGVSPYCASKAALIHLTRALAYEWARYGILVNAIAPGYIVTDMNRDVMSDPTVMNRLVSETPLRRLADVSDVGAAACFLASPYSSFMTGQVLVVDGGWTLP
ncbi:MAG: SDR family oxidoreductase [Firmicutes bacterium]|nr:SDR family oxidoreductase [Bacillota bacterium]